MSELTDASQGDTGASEDNAPVAPETTDVGDIHSDAPEDAAPEVDAQAEGEQAEVDQEGEAGPSIPDSAEGYTYTPIEGQDVDDASLDSFREFALENKMNQDHFQKVLEFSAERDKRIINEYETTMEEGREAVRSEMGDKLDSNLKRVKEVMLAAGQEVPKNDNDILDNPALFKFLLWTSEKIGQDSLGHATGHGSSTGESSAEDVLFGDMFDK